MRSAGSGRLNPPCFLLFRSPKCVSKWLALSFSLYFSLSLSLSLTFRFMNCLACRVDFTLANPAALPLTFSPWVVLKEPKPIIFIMASCSSSNPVSKNSFSRLAAICFAEEDDGPDPDPLLPSPSSLLLPEAAYLLSRTGLLLADLR